jgi:hypothetical protein
VGVSHGSPPILRAPDIAPDLSYAVFLQNTPILWDAVSRALPWAGMRCPVGAKGTMAFPIPRLIDVARRPIVETGANVPGYSGGVPPAQLFRIRIFCSRGWLTPVAAPNASPNVFLAWGPMRSSGFGAIVSRDVA